MRELRVLLHGRHVATLHEVGLSLGCALTFTEAAIALHGEGSPILSVTLPVRAETYPAVETSSFLDGLLPESHVREALAHRARVAVSDTFSLLAAYGRDCAGAVQILPMGEQPSRAPGVLWLDDDELQRAVAGLPMAPLGVSLDSGVRSSLGGLQGKLPLVVDDHRVGVPLDGQPSTHILKPARLLEAGTEAWPGIAEVEAYCLDVIRSAAMQEPKIHLRAAEASVRRVGARTALLVTRFDRRAVPDSDQPPHESILRIHQEDGAQALGINEKYQKFADLPPRLIDLAELLRTRATTPLLERQALLEWVTFNVVLGNCDAHARNISLMLDHGRVTVAPAYDVVSTAVWPDHDRELALRVGGEAMLDDVRRHHLIAEAVAWGIREKAAARIIDRTLQACRAAAAEAESRAKDEGRWHPSVGVAATDARTRIELLTEQ